MATVMPNNMIGINSARQASRDASLARPIAMIASPSNST